MKKSFIFLLSLLIFTTGLLAKEAGTYYVFAPSGLNMRATDQSGAKVLAKVPYGSKIELLSPAKTTDLTVDGLTAGMGKVRYEGQVGYMFEGYLSRFPIPGKNAKLEDYVYKVRPLVNGIVYYEEHSKDYDGYFTQEEAITVSGKDWHEAFLLGKNLFNMPAGLHFPDPNHKGKVENPDKPEYAWSDELTATYSEKDGRLIEISYYYRAEGGGSSITISYNEEDQGMRIVHGGVAD
ncbi:MAG: hypothetical protein AAF206_01180 [Bacteroidota bacterium]